MRISLVFFATGILFQSNVPAQEPPRKILFTPTVYYHEFSVKHQPVLKIHAGDTVLTESVDAGGIDKHGNRVTGRGNPLTGPFYIENAGPGDVLAITITSVKLNRDFAPTLNALIPDVAKKKTGKKDWRAARLVKWMLDTIHLTGSPDPRYTKLKDVKLPLHPFIGCVGVAPLAEKGMSSGASGYFGGNLDSRFVKEGATIYLPVFHPGAILFLGDAHAAQGDGELNGDALETSMNFSFTTRVIKQDASNIPVPMLEDSSYYMIYGVESGLGKAMNAATVKMTGWLQHNYGLDKQEISQVIGPAIEYRILKVAANTAEVAAMLPKKIVAGLVAKQVSEVP